MLRGKSFVKKRYKFSLQIEVYFLKIKKKLEIYKSFFDKYKFSRRNREILSRDRSLAMKK